MISLMKITGEGYKQSTLVTDVLHPAPQANMHQYAAFAYECLQTTSNAVVSPPALATSRANTYSIAESDMELI